MIANDPQNVFSWPFEQTINYSCASVERLVMRFLREACRCLVITFLSRRYRNYKNIFLLQLGQLFPIKVMTELDLYKENARK